MVEKVYLFNPIYKYLIYGLGIVIILFFLFGLVGAFWSSVPAGNIGIQDTFGNVSDQTLSPGFYFKSPFTAIIPVTIQTKKYSVSASAASLDLQDVATEITVNYHAIPTRIREIYINYSLDYEDRIIVPLVQETVKASTAQFTASELITQRPSVKEKVESQLKEKLQVYGVQVESVSLTDFKFSASFTEAIEAKVTAEQSALGAKNKLEQIKIEAEQTVTQAKAQADSTKLQADAQAYSLQVIREQLEKNNTLIQYQAIQQWNGVLPVYSGSGVVPFIDVKSIGQGE